MYIYIIFASVCIFISVISEYSKQKKILEIIEFIFLAFFMGLRYGIGQDYFYTYVPVFNNVIRGEKVDVEVGYELINKICAFFSKDYAFLFFVTALIFIFFICKTIKSYDISYSFAIFIFICGGFYLFSFNVMRQCIAIAISFYSLKYIEKNNISSYMILNLISASVHNTALLFIPLYFILNKKIKMKWYLLVIGIVFPLRFVLTTYISQFLMGTKYYNYIAGIYLDSSSSTLTTSQIINILMFILYCMYTKDDEEENFYIFKNMHFVGTLFSCLIGIVPLIGRVTASFYLIQFISLPYFYKHCFKQKYKKMAAIVIILMYLVLFIYSLIVNGNNVIPYHFIWQRYNY